MHRQAEFGAFLCLTVPKTAVESPETGPTGRVSGKKTACRSGEGGRKGEGEKEGKREGGRKGQRKEERGRREERKEEGGRKGEAEGEAVL